MYHNWYELSLIAKQVQRNLYRQADEARLVRESKRARRTKPDPAPSIAGMQSTFILQRNELISICVVRRPYRITCVTGRLWTTINDSLEDGMLVAGEAVTYCKNGRIVVQALRTTTVRIESPCPARIAVGSPLRPVFQLR